LENDSESTANKKVLLAEDERVIRETLVTILRQDGFEVLAVDCGIAAVEAARFWRPDIFLSDVVMPRMNGVEAAIRISKLYPLCRILLLSGQPSATDLLRAAHLQGHHFNLLLKPIHPTELLALLHGT
jgi:CheY-like chemotaxis protein